MLSKLTLALAWVALAVVAFAEHRPANQGLVKADIPYCFTIKNPPLLRSPDNAHDFRLGRPFNDKGTA